LADSVDYKNVGAKQHEHLQKHYYPMYSLNKFYEGREMKNPLEGEKNISYSPKIDGAAISLLYIDGTLTRVLTRGDGVEGTDITDKFLATNLVPKQLHYSGVLQITGEIAAPKHVPNSRNYAAGALNLKDINEFRTRSISFFAYGMQPYAHDTYDADMALLSKLGFGTIKDPEIHNIYPCDGLVYRVNSNKRFQELGYTSKAPKGAYALKEVGECVETTILSVEWNTSKSGKVTPVAILDPVYIGDKLVSRATLNNPGFIESLGIQIGDTVGLILGGEVIPVVTHKISG
jgi:DNA ligase (NAD+)